MQIILFVKILTQNLLHIPYGFLCCSNLCDFFYCLKSSLNCILKNEKYNGTFVFNKKKEKDALGKRNPKAKPEEVNDSCFFFIDNIFVCFFVYIITKRWLSSTMFTLICRVENGMPAIIDKQTFEKVQQKMIENKKRAGSFKAKHMYILSGMIFCGEFSLSINVSDGMPAIAMVSIILDNPFSVLSKADFNCFNSCCCCFNVVLWYYIWIR